MCVCGCVGVWVCGCVVVERVVLDRGRGGTGRDGPAPTCRAYRVAMAPEPYEKTPTLLPASALPFSLTRHSRFANAAAV
jgi:hypothetical protein